MGDSKIEWTDKTWNPVRGCIKVSPGCKHCYAETFAERFRGVAGHPYEQGFDPRLVPEKLGEPLRWRKSSRVFVNSMSDLFQEAVPDSYIAACFGVMAAARWHTFQVLTKRADRMWQWSDEIDAGGEAPELVACEAAKILHANDRGAHLSFEHHCAEEWPLPNVHLGVSVEDRRFGVPRIDVLRKTPAAVRFLSIEPLLEDIGELDLTGIHQVIVGAESGRGARLMREAWVRSIRDQAKAAGAAFFYKQRLDEAGHKVSLPLLDGRQWAEQPSALSRAA